MGLFSFNYAKPGPGVSKDAPRKKGIFLYFELLGRKFFKLFQAMWLCGIFSIPYLVLMFLFVIGIFGGYFMDVVNNVVAEGALQQSDLSTLMLMMCGFVTMLIYFLLGSGPASAGFAYITRCFTREEHAWILSDFLKNVKENFKQSMILVVIDFLVLFLVPNAVIQYWNLYTAQNQFVWLLLMYVCVMAFIVYTFIHYHIYQIMVTYECKFKDLIKNAMLLALGKAPLNLVLTALAAAVLIAVFNFLHPLFAMLISVVVLFGLLRFPLEFYSARTIEKIMANATEEK